jgi:hypothetical protein
VACLRVSPLGGSRDETQCGQGIRERSVSWNLPKLSQLWRCKRRFRGRPVRFAAHRQPLYWNFMYHSRLVLSVGGCMWYVVWNLRCTVTIDSVLANSKTPNAFWFPVHAMFRHNCRLAVKPASTPRRLVHKNTWRDSLSIDMLPFSMIIPATVPQRSEIPERLMNYPV